MTEEASNKPNSESWAGLHIAAFTLLGALLSAGGGWLSANQTASVSYRQSCLARVDAREAILRSKAEAFFSAQGSLIALASHRNPNDQDYEERLDEIVKSAYSLSSYLDLKTYETPKLIAQRIVEKFYPEKSAEQKENNEQDNKLLLDLLNNWNDQYNSLLASFESIRDGC